MKLRVCGAKQITSDGEGSCNHSVLLPANCITTGLFVRQFSRHTPRSPFLVRQTQKPVNCSLGLIRLFCCSASCTPLKPSQLTFKQFGLRSAVIVVHFSFCHWLAGWLDAEGWARGKKKLPCLVVSGQEKPLTAVLRHLNLPGIQPGQQVLPTKAFKRKASLLRSQLWVKDPRGTCSEVTPNQILSDSRMLPLENGNPKVKLCVVVLGLFFGFCYLHCCSVQCILGENWEIRIHMM